MSKDITNRAFPLYYILLLLSVSLGVQAQMNQGEPHVQDKAFEKKFINIRDLSDKFILDMKYATKENFLGQVVYDCPKCYLRKATAQALVAAEADFLKLRYTLKLFDCYRPLSVQ